MVAGFSDCIPPQPQNIALDTAAKFRHTMNYFSFTTKLLSAATNGLIAIILVHTFFKNISSQSYRPPLLLMMVMVYGNGNG